MGISASPSFWDAVDETSPVEDEECTTRVQTCTALLPAVDKATGIQRAEGLSRWVTTAVEGDTRALTSPFALSCRLRALVSERMPRGVRIAMWERAVGRSTDVQGVTNVV
jgi:hypothetical protein